MRLFMGLLLALLFSPLAAAQDKEPERRFGLSQYPQLYSQESPKKALASLLRAMEKNRYDYIVAHLLEPGYVDEQLKISYPIYEKQATEQVRKEELEKKGFDRNFIRNRVAQLAVQANFEYLVGRVKAKLDNDPESAKELKRMGRDGEFQEGGESSAVRLKDIKDRALYFRHIGDRWFIENKMQE
jgi:hypothetical protein